ncbi:MAG: FxsA family protein [Actinomycetota bacterium]
MFAPLLLALLIVPLVEIYVLIQVGERIGIPQTILLLIVMSIAGAWLLRREGSAAWRRLRTAISEGRVPTNEVVDGAMILFGGALMLTPGFITDILGVLLILPPTRTPLKGAFRKLLGGWFLGRAGTVGRASRAAYGASVIRSRRVRSEPGPTKRLPGESTPSSPAPEGGVDSPDRA